MTDFYTPADLAEMLGITEAQVLEYRRNYRWPSLKVGKTIRFSQTHVEQIVAQHSAQPKKAAAAVAAIPGQTKRSAGRSA